MTGREVPRLLINDNNRVLAIEDYDGGIQLFNNAYINGASIKY